MAHETLRLRAAHRWLAGNPATTAQEWDLWDSLIERESWKVVFARLRESESLLIREACNHADYEALQLELGPKNRNEVSEEIRKRLKPFFKDGRPPRNAVLIGGPPCQAYSVVGRARNRGEKDYVAENDHRHFLYEEYLHVIAEFKPAVFVMENVKGILSSQVGDGQIFQRILSDLRKPGLEADGGRDVEYVLVPLAQQVDGSEPAPDDFIIRAEEFGIPQARHRVIIFGIRLDLYRSLKSFQRPRRAPAPTVSQVIGDLPRIRPEVSNRGKGASVQVASWIDAFSLRIFEDAIRALRNSGTSYGQKVALLMLKSKVDLMNRQSDPGSGSDRIRMLKGERRKKPRKLADWYVDRKTNLLTNHESRSHMASDLVRYLFVSAFGKVTGRSPKLVDFPKCLLPEHKNIDPDSISDSIFKDRFRVQIGSRYGMTVTSHIAKDGHAFIHYNPKQCRSLSVREAARLQTFPDSYVFLGNRTSQYSQVGNAVPPKLANQIAEVVARILTQAGPV